jgi:hypothetical protein
MVATRHTSLATNGHVLSWNVAGGKSSLLILADGAKDRLDVARSSHNDIFISRYIVVAAVTCASTRSRSPVRR